MRERGCTWDMNDTPDDGGHNLHPGYREGDGELGPGGHQGGPGRGFTGHSKGLRIRFLFFKMGPSHY